jgi:hypothetical protein
VDARFDRRALLASASLLWLPAVTAGCGARSLCDDAPRPPRGLRWGPVLGRVTGRGARLAVTTSRPRRVALELTHPDGVAETLVGPEALARTLFDLEGLVPDAAYAYALRLDDAPVAESYGFRTAPEDPSAAVRFVAVGDGGTGCPIALRVVRRIREAQPHFVVHLGDAAYLDGSPARVRAGLLLPYAPLLSSVPVYLTLGNHDLGTRNGAPILEALEQPAGPGNERWFSVARGCVHLCVLDAYSPLAPGSEQHAWLAADLAAADRAWKVVAIHTPPYNNGRHPPAEAVRAHLVPLFEAHGVDLVLSGDDHNFQRTFPVRGGEAVARASDPDFVAPGAPVYVVSGGGGKDLYEAAAGGVVAQAEVLHHALVVDATPGRLAARCVDLHGETRGAFSIAKP